MSIYLSENEIRKLIKSSLIKEAGSGLFSNSLKKYNIGSTSVDDNNDNNVISLKDLNFEFEPIPDQNAANKAKQELNAWGDKKENDDSVKAKLSAYWEKLGSKYNNAIKENLPWSAAFISFVMGNQGIFNSAAHIDWKNKAENNTKAINKEPEKYIGKYFNILLPLETGVNPTVGDIVWKPRGSDPNQSHSDIVVGPGKAIGGNLSNTVKEVKIDHPFIIKKVKITGTKKA